MGARMALFVVAGSAWLGVSCTQNPQLPAAVPAPKAAWSQAELDQRTQQLCEELTLGKASFHDVLDFALGALADDSVERRALPATASGIRTLQLTVAGDAREEIARFDENACARLALSFAFGATAPESCSATCANEFKPSEALMKSVTADHPVLVGGTLRVDSAGACTWRGMAIRWFKDGPRWRQVESEPEPRAAVSPTDPRLAELRRTLDSLQKP